MHVLLLEEREDGVRPATRLLPRALPGLADPPEVLLPSSLVDGEDVRLRAAARRNPLALIPAAIAGQHAEVVVVLQQGQADLLQVVGTPRAAGGLPHFLHRGNDQADQDANDGKNDE
jgi:hypothetical protein